MMLIHHTPWYHTLLSHIQHTQLRQPGVGHTGLLTVQMPCTDKGLAEVRFSVIVDNHVTQEFMSSDNERLIDELSRGSNILYRREM